jgi:hypothetical protein
MEREGGAEEVPGCSVLPSSKVLQGLMQLLSLAVALKIEGWESYREG